MLERREGFTAFLTDGRVRLSNDAAERAARAAWPSAGRHGSSRGSDRGGERAAFMRTLIGTAKPGGVDPRARLGCVLGRIADTPRPRLGELLPRERARPRVDAAAVAA